MKINTSTLILLVIGVFILWSMMDGTPSSMTITPRGSVETVDQSEPNVVYIRQPQLPSWSKHRAPGEHGDPVQLPNPSDPDQREGIENFSFDTWVKD